jgi:hypothetical protein
MLEPKPKDPEDPPPAKAPQPEEKPAGKDSEDKK